MSILPNKDQKWRWKGSEEAWAAATGLLYQNSKNMDPILQWEKNSYFRGKLSILAATRVSFSRKVNSSSLWIWKLNLRGTIKHLNYIFHSKYKKAINKIETSTWVASMWTCSKPLPTQSDKDEEKRRVTDRLSSAFRCLLSFLSSLQLVQ